MLQGGSVSGTFLLRTDAAPTSMVAGVRRVVNEVLPDVAIVRVDTLADQLDASILPERMIAMLSTVFGVLAALLVAIGLYGLLAFTVTRRTNEIGVRLALGATASDVRRMVLTDGLRLAGAGLLAGVPTAWLVKGYAASALTAMATTQANAPVTLPVAGVPTLVAASSIGLLTVALVASYFPARRATRVDPMVALRSE
jgi:ABC-type antimicrobial peptide transport system permease subunit